VLQERGYHRRLVAVVLSVQAVVLQVLVPELRLQVVPRAQ